MLEVIFLVIFILLIIEWVLQFKFKKNYGKCRKFTTLNWKEIFQCFILSLRELFSQVYIQCYWNSGRIFILFLTRLWREVCLSRIFRTGPVRSGTGETLFLVGARRHSAWWHSDTHRWWFNQRLHTKPVIPPSASALPCRSQPSAAAC